MMTREQVLAEMEEDYALMTEDFRNKVLFNDGGRDWTPTLLITEVRNDTEYGKKYVKAWSDNRDQQVAVTALLEQLLGGAPAPGGGSCDDPDCDGHHDDKD